jgi:hypothetical protein
MRINEFAGCAKYNYHDRHLTSDEPSAHKRSSPVDKRTTPSLRAAMWISMVKTKYFY